ncbi:DNA cytosine methyltransferase [Lactococcus lactis]|uniref:DNA cytosine methyltransferase n=1 Tax=Lactococcus lactis TaxID=1358 RepID=UPI00210AC05B|nr:DNA (cytosine-5-)-methyltransferase [Lactococcus lactis]MCQ4972190.1 DNA (cytosine-5-)-methyltransferase [Lactococcus lactis]MCQ4997996.1 DNA (cytosine-5-)-methyltransferase [Lactococcus lactis]
MKFLDLFAGIGGFRLGLEQAGHECVGFCEIDKFARQSYKAIHNTEGEREYHDITTVSNEEWRTLRGTVELICGGFPCQAFSIAGKRKGFLDETRGTLFFEIARAAEQIKPRTLFLENVRGLLSHDKGRTFRTIISTLDELGYDAEWQILNSKNFGVPQNRERVFIIGHLRGERGREVFPITRENRGRVGKQVAQTLDTSCNQAVIVQKPRGYNKGGEHEVAPTLSSNSWHENNLLKLGGLYTNASENHQRGVLPGLSRTLKSQNHDAGIFDGIRIRKLTPRECWRLQGFPDWAFDKAQEVNSNSQLYKQAGNSVTVPVIYEIARRFE